MKKQTLTICRQLHPAKSVVLAILISGLLGVDPYWANAQDQIEVVDARQPAQQSAPLTGVIESNKNPLQIALLRWYAANLTTTFDVGSVGTMSPQDLAFDGSIFGWQTREAAALPECALATAQ